MPLKAEKQCTVVSSVVTLRITVFCWEQPGILSEGQGKTLKRYSCFVGSAAGFTVPRIQYTRIEIFVVRDRSLIVNALTCPVIWIFWCEHSV